MTTAVDNVFEPLPMRRRAFTHVIANQYRVMRRAGDAKQVEASTAYEAFRLSGFEDAIRIERISNFDNPLLQKNELSDIPSDTGSALQEASRKSDPLEQIKRQKNPIVSANELDSLMRALQQMAAAAELPSADIQPSEAFAPGPTGMDVHGDGFDEIIPSAPATKPASSLKPAAPPVDEPESAPAPVPSAQLPPERELSPDEITKLLGDTK